MAEIVEELRYGFPSQLQRLSYGLVGYRDAHRISDARVCRQIEHVSRDLLTRRSVHTDCHRAVSISQATDGLTCYSGCECSLCRQKLCDDPQVEAEDG
jgi:hypothetical protein